MSLLSNIGKNMEIITIDGKCLGRVTFLSEPDQIGVSGHKEFVPVKWIAWVDGSVYLSKTRQQIISSWNSVEPEVRRLVRSGKLDVSDVIDSRPSSDVSSPQVQASATRSSFETPEEQAPPLARRFRGIYR